MNEKELREKHLALVAGIARAPRNGLICYTYNGGRAEEDYQPPKLVNIGDSIQSLAARQYFPSIAVSVDRDQLGDYAGGTVNMIMNAWYKVWRRNMVFPEAINPLLVSVHLHNPEVLSEDSLAYFKRHEPVGCRDVSTVDFFRSKGIEAYFTGCLTLTLGRTYCAPAGAKREGIYFVDYLFGYDEKIDAELRKVLNGFSRRRPCYVRSHFYPIEMDSDSRLQEAEALLREYARAELVITRNIHCALPCLALGTPVIFVTPKYDARRFSGLISFFNHIGYDEGHNCICSLKRDERGHIANPDTYVEYARHLERIALSFGGGGFAGLDPQGVPVVPRRRYGEAERETGFLRRIFQRRKIGNGRMYLLFGHRVFGRRGKERV